MDRPTIDDLPDCLIAFGKSLMSDEIDEILIVFTLIGALSAVAGHLADEYSEYQSGVYTSNPITVSNIIIADSGSGKSRICKHVFDEVNNWIDNQIPIYNKSMKKFKLELRKINSNISIKNNSFEIEGGLMPDEPISPNFIMEDFTIEALSRVYHIGAPHLTIFSEEGGNVISSRAFSKRSINTTLSFFNKIMCGERAIVNTVKDGQRTLVNKRLTMLLLMQDSFFKDFIDRSCNQACAGTYQRIFPIRVKNKRKLMADKKHISHNELDQAEIQASKKLFADFCDQKLEFNGNGILSPSLIKKSPKAHELWFRYFGVQNDFCAKNPTDETVSYRLRNVETVSRYATLFQLADNFFVREKELKRLNTPVTLKNMKKAIRVCKYGLACQIKEFIRNDNELDKISRILKYIKEKDIVSRVDMIRNLPRYCRQARVVDNSLLFLIEEGYIEKLPDGFRWTGKKT